MEQRAQNTRSQDWFTFTPRPPGWLLFGGPALWCLATVMGTVGDLIAPHGSLVWFLAFLVPGLLGAVVLVMLWRYVRREQISLLPGAEELVVRKGSGATSSVSWTDVTRVQEGPQSLVFDLTGARRLVLSSPSPRFPSAPLIRAVASRLDASRGYQSSLCDLSGEPEPQAIAHGGCDNPLGCANAGGCAVAQLRGGVGTTQA